MIKFSITPNTAFRTMLVNMVTGYNKPWIDGIMDDAYQYQLDRADDAKPLRIYMVCKLEEKSGVQYYTNPLAVVAFNESDAVNHYYNWTGNNGSCIGIMSYNAGKETVEAPRG